MTPNEAIERLKRGNQRFLSGKLMNLTALKPPAAFVHGQQPFATILSCADSRVPPEIVFDQGIGDLFVIRVAGNIATTTQRGSIEYAVSILNTPLVMVLGHSQCGGVQAALNEKDSHLPTNLSSLVLKIKRNIGRALDHDDELTLEIEPAVKANAVQTARNIVQQSSIVADKQADHTCQVIAAYYDLASGVVEFLNSNV